MTARHPHRPYTRQVPLVALLVLITLSWQAFTLDAQNACGEESLNLASKKYQTGNFDEVVRLLRPCLSAGSFNDQQKQEAYRLMAMTFLAIDSTTQARNMTISLLAINPNFEPGLFDAQGFIRLIREMKESGSALLVRSVSKKSENLYEAPASVMIITDREIRERGYADIEAIFSDLPGFDISRNYSSIYSNLYQRGYRSNETNRTLFLIDGVEENNIWSNTCYWDMQYPLSNISRIEVVYGPASTMYGANAFAGVVNVITKEPEEITRGRTFGAEARLGTGSYHTRFADVTLAAKYRSVSFSLTGRAYLSDQMDLSDYPEYNYDPADYDQIDYKSLLSVTSGAQDYYTNNSLNDSSFLYSVIRDANQLVTSLNLTDSGESLARSLDKAAVTGKVFDGRELGYSNIYEDYLVYGKLRISDFTLGFQRWKARHGGTNLFNDNNISGALNGSEFDPVQNFFYAKYEKNINEKLILTNTAQYMVHELDNGTSSLTLNNYSNGKKKLIDLVRGKVPDWISINLYQISKQLRNEFKVIYNPSSRIDLVGGIEVRNSLLQGNYLISPFGEYPSDSGFVGGSPTAQGQILGGNGYDIRDFGVYAQGNYKPFPAWKFTIGARIDDNSIRKLGGYGTQFNPRVAVVFSPKRFVFKAIYSEAMKDADNWTKFATTDFRRLPSPSLEPEKARNLEISAAFHPGKDFYWCLNGFSTSYSGVIGTIEVPYQGGVTTQNAPIGSMSISGLESNFTWKYGKYSLYGNYTLIIDTESEEKGVRSEIGDISRHKANLGINALYLNRLNLNLRLNYIGERKTGPGTTVPLNPGEFPAHMVVHFSAGYEWPWGLSCTAVCSNLFDARYSDPGVRQADGNYYAYRTPQKGRNIFLQLTYQLSK